MTQIPISGHTQLACLLGSPVAHSISPAMHNEAFSYYDIDCRYLAFDVAPGELPLVTDALRKMNVLGFNLTMPHKTQMCSLCDELSTASRLGQTVNTVKNENGKLMGYTTDGIGFMDSCKDAGFSILGKKMTLLGAGGAACAILIQAALEGVSEITVFSRQGDNFNRTMQLMKELSLETSCRLKLYDYEDQKRFHKEIQESSILVNATSVGMAPNLSGCLISDAAILKGLMVYDVIYNPFETKLLQMAKEQGCRTANGLYMLLYQGAAAFKIWTGKEMPIEQIKEKYFSIQK